MKVLHSDRRTLQLLSILNADNKPYYWKLSPIICVITPVFFLLPVIWYFFSHLTNVSEATNAFYMICINGMATLTYLEYWRKRSTILSILWRIQMLVDSASKDCHPIYVKAEFIAHHIARYFRIFLFSSVFSVVSLPLAIVIVVSILGGDTTDFRILPAALR